MKKPCHFIVVATALVGILLGLSGCADPQKEALKEVGAKGYEFSTQGLLSAAAAGDVAGLERFQAAGMDMDTVDEAGNTALIKASGAGRAMAVERLLGMGADPRKVNGAGRDALLSASAKGHEEVARMLLSRGGDTALRDGEGWGALSIAAYNGHAGVVSLLAANATPSELDDALLVASFGGDAKVIDTLLGQGANINARSPESKTPLMIAAEAGKHEAVRALLQNQANPYAVDLENRTATDLAATAGHAEVAKLIATPSSWGESEKGKQVAGEMDKARAALASEGTVETLLEGMPLAGEPARGGATGTTGPGQTPSSSAPSSPSVASQQAPASAPSSPATAPAVPVSAARNADPGAAPAMAASTTSSTSPISANSGGGASPAPSDQSAPNSPSMTMAAGSPVLAPRPDTPERSRAAAARQVREESKSKPIVALNGSTLHSRQPEAAPVKGMVLAAYHEEALPLLVDGVSGSTASVRRLGQGGGSVEVEEGSVIPGTPYKVKGVSTRFVSSKEGKGRMVDVSRVEVEDTGSGETHLLVKDAAGQTSDAYAILTAPNSRYRYVVKAGDSFRTTQPGVGEKDYQVLDVRANAVVIKDLATEEVVTVARDGVLAQ